MNAFKSIERSDVIRPQVGMGVTISLYSDRYTYTIIAISSSGKQLTLQRDKVILNKDFKPDFHVGGFVGHVSNQEDQSYTYERDLEGEKVIARMSKSGVFYARKISTKPIALNVRREFYDYNF